MGTPCRILFFCVLPLQALSQNFGFVGASYDQFSRPQIAGMAGFATKISDKGPIYTFTEWTISSAKTKPFTSQTTVTTGLATPVKQIGPVTIYGFANMGMATSSTHAGGAYTGGGVGLYKLGKTDWYVIAAAQFLKSNVNNLKSSPNQQTVLSVGIGRSF